MEPSMQQQWVDGANVATASVTAAPAALTGSPHTEDVQSSRAKAPTKASQPPADSGDEDDEDDIPVGKLGTKQWR
jgi:hypothetical protein